jgi:hypothetical protein
MFFTTTTLPGNFPGIEADVLGFFPASLILVAGFDVVCTRFDEIPERGLTAKAAPPAPRIVKNFLRFRVLPFILNGK